LDINDSIVGVIRDETTIFIIRSKSGKHEAAPTKVNQDRTGMLLLLSGWFVDMGFDGSTRVPRRDKDCLFWIWMEI
jgi:hypothetical protein